MIFKKLDGSLGREIVSLTITIVASLSSIIFLFRIIGFADYLVSQDGFLNLIMFIVFLIPSIFKITVPISLFLASTIAIIRMANDRELEAWMASGVSVLRMTFMPLIVGLIAFLFSLYISLIFEPYSYQEYRKFKWMYARKSVEVLLEQKIRPKTFLSNLFDTRNAQIAFYAEEVSESRRDFSGVFLASSKSSSPYTSVLVSESGMLSKEVRDGLPDYVLKLKDGYIYHPLENKKSTPDDLTPIPDWNVTEFDELNVSLVNMFQKQFDPGAFNADSIRAQYPKQYISMLKKHRSSPTWGKDQTLVRDHTFFYEQIVVPFSCLLLPIIGLCLGVQDPRRKAGYAYAGMGLVLFLYYASIMVCQHLATSYVVSPEITLFVPPVLLLILSIIVIRWRVVEPPSATFLEFLKGDFGRASRFLSGIRKKMTS